MLRKDTGKDRRREYYSDFPWEIVSNSEYDVTSQDIWAATWQNQQNGYAPSEDRSAWASTQSDQSLRCPHEEALSP